MKFLYSYYQVNLVYAILFCINLIPQSFFTQSKDQSTLLQNIPFEFLENKGQMKDINGSPVPQVYFKSEALGMDIYVTNKGLTYVFNKVQKIKGDPEKGIADQAKVDFEKIDLELPGAKISAGNLVKEFPSAGSFNYLVNPVESSIRGLKKYKKLTFTNVYPGIDWVIYSSTKEGLKYDFVLHPGADPQKIRMLYTSSSTLSIGKDGQLEQHHRLGSLVEQAPYTYKYKDQIALPNNFKILKSEIRNGICKTLVSFTHKSKFSETVIIDPQLLWATFYGGSSFEGTRCLDIDKWGNMIMTGYTSSTNLPLLNSGSYFDATPSQCFILKFDHSGAFVWATYFGGSNTQGYYLDCDPFGNFFLTGTTLNTSTFPLVSTGNYFQNTILGGQDFFISKFDSSGACLWSTYFGGTGSESSPSCSSDSNGNVFVVGISTSTNMPLMNAGSYFDNSPSTGNNGIVTKFSNNGAYLWGTYFKGISFPVANTDHSGNLYITAQSFSNLPVFNPGAGAYFQNSMGSPQDVGIIKFDNSGNQLWTTFYGGNQNEIGKSLVCDKNGNLFVTGTTNSSDFPVLSNNTYFQATNSFTQATDAFFLKFNPNGVRLWATYFGGSRAETISDYDHLAIDTCGQLYFGLTTQSRNIPLMTDCSGGFYDNSIDTSVNSSNLENYLGKFSNNGDLLWGTYFGGAGHDFRTSLAVDEQNTLFVTGEWVANNASLTPTYPVVNGGGNSYNAVYGGSDDLFLSKFHFNTLSSSFSYNSPYCTSSAGTYSPNFSLGFGAGGTFSTQSGLSLNGSNGNINPSASSPGTYTVSYSLASCACLGTTVQASTSATVQINATPVLTLSGQFTVCPGEKRTFTVSGAQSYTWSNNSNGTTFSITAPSQTANLNYYVLGSNNNGCNASQTFSVYVRPCLSLEEIGNAGAGVRIYPNPNKGEFNVISEEPGEFIISNAAGQVVKEFTLQSAERNQTVINNLAAGIYILKRKNSKLEESWKIIIQD